MGLVHAPESAQIRETTLINRTLVSATRIANVGQDSIHFRWFPHPFFPNPEGECCKFNLTVTFPDNPGYEMLGNSFIQTKLDHPWDRRGHFQAWQFSPVAALSSFITPRPTAAT